MRKLLAKIRKILKDRRTRQLLTRTVSVTAAIVVFVTTYALVLPAITMETEADCGLEAHQHDSSCYEVRLVCSEAESPSHHHTEECCRITRTLVCSQDVHQHDGECYDDEGNLICEQVEHVHDDSCYEEVRELVCDIPESEGHQHTDACYDQVLICGKEAHTHSSACYSNSDSAASAWSTESVAVAATENSAAGITVQTYENTVIDADTDEEAVDSSDTFDNVDTFAPSETSNPANSIDTVAADDTIGAASGVSTVSETFANDAASANDEATASSSIVPAASTEATESSAAASSTSSTSSTVSNASSASAASTAAETSAETSAEDAYVPVLDPLDFNQILTDETRIYYFHPENKEAEPENSGEITTWNLLDDKTILDSADIIRVYLAYSIPAGSLNETNPVARYRLPSNLHLSDSQVEAINSTVNGIANQYVSMDTLEITDPEKYSQALGVEAIEGTRQPSDDPEEYFAMHTETGGQEYISATVKAEDIYDTDDTNAVNTGTDANDTNGTYSGTDLVFTFTPYSVRKNQHTYDSTGKPTSAGQKIHGWLTFDLRTDQIDFETIDESIDLETKKNTDFELNISDSIETDLNENAVVTREAAIIFVPETRDVQSGLDIGEISQTLHLQEIMTETDSAFKDKSEEADKGAGSDKGADSDKEDSKKAEKDDEAEKTALLYPAVTFQDSITASIGSLSTDTETGQTTALPEQTELTVYVEADEGTFPEGTTMKLSTVEDMDTVASAVEEAVTSDDAISNKTRGFHAVDISFRDTEDNEIEPLKPIRVSIKSESIKQAVEETSTAPVVVHVADPMADNALEDRTDEDKSHNSEEEKESSNPEKAERPDTEEYTKDNGDKESPIATVVETEKQVSTENSQTDDTDTLTFEAGTFSVYAIVYTVDFHWEVDGKSFDFSIPGGGFVSFEHLIEMLGLGVGDSKIENGSEGADFLTENGEITEDGSTMYYESIKLNELEVSEATKTFVTDVEGVEFSSPELVWVGRIDEDTTVGELKEANGLECEYSAELTGTQIAEINAQTVDSGDWVLISVHPFTSEETLTVTMKNGEQFVVKVTDAAIAKESLVPDAGYIIYTQVGNKYYVLKTDGTTGEYDSTVEMDHLGNEYKWKFTYVYSENGIERYNIRPYNDKSISLSLNYAGQPLVANGPNNITIVPVDEENIDAGYIFGGFHNALLKLNNDHAFVGAENDSTPVFIYQLEDLHDFEFTVVTNDNAIGKVSGIDKDGASQSEVAIFTAVTKNYPDVTVDKANRNIITAVADTSIQGANNTGSRYVFDHWELNGQPLYKNAAGKITTEVTYTPQSQNTDNPIPDYWRETIAEEELIIPYNGSTLRAVFSESSTYEAQDDDKQGTEFESMDAWLSSLIENNSPIKESATKKTAEVYDYENRVYRVDLTTQSNLRTVNGNLDLGFVLDVSGSMKFPSKLNEDTTQGVRDVWQINDPSPDANWYWDGWQQKYVPDRYIWQDWGFIPGNYYYVIAEKDTRATVFRLYYDTNEKAWRRVDSSYEDSDSSARTISSSTAFGVDNSGNTTGYQIYVDGDYPNKRLNYEQSSLTNTISSLKELIIALTLVKEDSQNPDVKNPDSRIAWNTFCANIPKWHPEFTSVTSDQTIISNSDYAYNGGTRTDLALGTGDEGIKDQYGNVTTPVHNYGAYNFQWDIDNKSNYVILLTDGAPQYGQRQTGPSTATGKQQLKENTATLVEAVKDKIADLKEDKNVKIITVGLSMDDVEQGRKMLYDVADTVNGERMFYSAESGDQLEDILLHIIDTIMVDATVVGNVTDTIGEAFYPVDLATGAPLDDGDYIDLYGNKVDSAYADFKGKVTKEGNTYKVEWPDQDIPKTGWRGTVYVKAKEDFLGGNAVVTNNDDLGIANVTASAYRVPGSDTVYPLADEAYVLDNDGNRVINTNYKLTKDMNTPRVNVNELNFLQNNTEWTVYLGTEVDPLEQIKALYNNIEVEEVIQEGAAGSGKLPSELVSGKTKDDYSYDYTESISDKREPKAGTTQTFLLKDLIESLVDKTGYTSTDWWDYTNNEIRWDELIRLANLAEQDEITADNPEDPDDPAGAQDENKGLIIPYKPYGMQDGGFIRIMLTQETEGTEIDYSGNIIPAHETMQIGDGVEKYSLTVFYTPDYSTVPVGQGGDPATAKEFRTGGFGTAYQGHAAGTEESINDHEINVYAKGLDVQKIDELNQPLPGAEFSLYREAAQEETGETLDPVYGLTGSYIQVASGTSGTNGIADLGEFILDKDITYYLVETSVPAGYQRDTVHKVVKLEASEHGVFTDLKNTVLTEKTYPFNWAQGVKLLVDGEASQTVNAEIVGGYAKLTPELLFRATVLNERKSTSLEVTKNWKDKTGKATAEDGYTVSFKLTRRVGESEPEDVALTAANLVSTVGVSLSNNIVTLTYSSADGWPTAQIVKLPYEEIIGTGTRKYIYDVVETAHTPAENEVTVSYGRTVQDDQNIDITIENTDVEEPVNISVEKKWLDAHGNPWAVPDLDEITFTLYKVHYIPCDHNWVDTDNCKPATCEEDGLYERRCTKCEEIESTVLPRTGHDWGEWEIVIPSQWDASLNNGEGGIAPGIKQRICKNDPAHKETEEYTIEEHECTPGEWTTTKAPTCELAGEETQYCTICLKPLATRAIPALDHNWQVSSVQAATCHAEGRVDYICLNDPSHTKFETVPKLDHIWGEWYVYRAATTEQEGEMRRDCLRECGEYDSKPIPKLPSVVNVSVYTDRQKYGNYYTHERVQNYEVEIGSTLHIEFEEFWFRRDFLIPGVRYRLNCTESWNESQQAYELQGTDSPMNVSYKSASWPGIGSWEYPVYSLDIEITENTRLDICIPNSWYMGTPTPNITITEPEPSNAHAPGMNTNAAFAPRLNKAVSLSKFAMRMRGPVSKGSLAPEQLNAIMADFITPEELEQREKKDDVWIKEVVGSYTISKDDTTPWHWNSTDLPRSDELGRPYTYYVTETAPSSGYVTTYSSDQADGLTDDETETITNQQLPGGLKIIKEVTVDNAPTTTSLADGEYTFTVTKKNDSTFEAQTVTLSVSGGQAETSGEISNLLPGTYIITEGVPTNGTAISFINGRTTSSYSTEVEVLAGRTGSTAVTATFVNNYRTAQLTLKKADNESRKQIAGAKFSLKKGMEYADLSLLNVVVLDETGNPTTTPATIETLHRTSPNVDLEVIVVPQNGVKIFGLLNGTYTLQEEEAPAGYIITDSGTTFTVANGAVDGDPNHTFTIENEHGAALPSTGGPGTNLIYLIGIMLSGLAGASLVMRRKRKAA